MLTIASSNDPYDPDGRGIELGERAGAAVVRLGDRGHLNEKSGVGDRAEGAGLLTAFQAGFAAGQAKNEGSRL